MCVYHPGFDPDRLAELGLFAKKGEQSRTSPVPMKLIIIDSHIALIPSMRSYAPGHELQCLDRDVTHFWWKHCNGFLRQSGMLPYRSCHLW